MACTGWAVSARNAVAVHGAASRFVRCLGSRRDSIEPLRAPLSAIDGGPSPPAPAKIVHTRSAAATLSLWRRSSGCFPVRFGRGSQNHAAGWYSCRLRDRGQRPARRGADPHNSALSAGFMESAGGLLAVVATVANSQRASAENHAVGLSPGRRSGSGPWPSRQAQSALGFGWAIPERFCGSVASFAFGISWQIRSLPPSEALG